MTESSESPRPKSKSKWWRRLRWIAAGALGLVVVVVAALPWIIGTPVVRRAIVAQANQIYAPTVFEVDGLSVSWTEPVRLRGVVLRDGNGKAVVSSPTATLDRSIWQLITMMPDFGTLTLHEADVDIERREDGSIDLAEALDPILSGGDDEDDEPDDRPSKTRFTLAIDGGTLHLTSPELARPITAETLEMTLHCLPAPLSWEITLENPDTQALIVSGHYDSRDPEATEVLVAIAGSRWPLAVEQGGVTIETIFAGEVGVKMVGDDLELKGETVLNRVLLGGPALKGDRPAFDRIEAAWDLDLAGAGLSLRSIEIDSPVAKVGLAPDGPEGGSKWVGSVDLAALAGRLPNTLALRDGMSLDRGSADVEVILGASRDDGSTPATVIARLANLAARDGDRVVTMAEPITVSAQVLQGGSMANVVVEAASVDSAFLKAKGQGDLADGVTFDGSIDLDALDQQLRQWVDLGEVVLAGSGRFGGDYKKDEGRDAFTTRVALEGRDLRISGLTEEPIARDAARIDLIVQGPSAPPGIPAGWHRIHAAATIEGIDLAVDVAPVKDAMVVQGRVLMPHPPTAEGEPSPLPPTTLAFDALYRSLDDRVDFSEVLVEHELGRVRAAGRIDAISTARVAALTGSFDPNWDAISAVVAEATEPQARLVGTPRPFRLNGPLAGGTPLEMIAGIDAELGVDLTEATVFGLQVGPAPLIARVDRGNIAIEPISTTLNGGRIVVTPALFAGEDGEVILTVGEGSGIDGVEITDDVSRRVLAYIAPVLREATQVHGKLSARIDRLSVPLISPAPEVEGTPVDMAARVVFQDVNYGPGPVMQRILGLSGLSAQQVPHLTINQMVNVAITEGRVHQSGLEIVATEGVALQLEGSVGLDQTLAMRVGVPLSERMLGGQEILNDVLGGTRVGLPIGGTLSQPQLDQDAFRVGLKQQGGRLISRGAAVGAGQLLRMLGDDEGAGATDGEGPGNPPPVAPPAEDLLRGVGRGLIRGALGGGSDQPQQAPPPQGGGNQP